jgi:hypothetical protein
MEIVFDRRIRGFRPGGRTCRRPPAPWTSRAAGTPGARFPSRTRHRGRGSREGTRGGRRPGPRVCHKKSKWLSGKTASRRQLKVGGSGYGFYARIHRDYSSKISFLSCSEEVALQFQKSSFPHGSVTIPPAKRASNPPADGLLTQRSMGLWGVGQLTHPLSYLTIFNVSQIKYFRISVGVLFERLDLIRSFHIVYSHPPEFFTVAPVW